MRLCAMLALLAGLSFPAAAATVFFEGSGASGVINYTSAPGGTGYGFLVDEDSDSWGIPGYNEGTLPWNLGDGFTDFHITFGGLPNGVSLAVTTSASCGDNTQNVFCHDSPGSVWDAVFDGPNSISFYATSLANVLDDGDRFYVNIFFDGDIVADDLTFAGSFTMDGAVPEPSTYLLMGAGLGFVALIQKRRRSLQS